MKKFKFKKLERITHTLIHEDTSGKDKSKLSIGFEWEVPLDKSLFFESQANYDTVRKNCARLTYIMNGWDDLGFRWHQECGGAEGASPVCWNLSTAKKYVRAVNERVREHPDLFRPERGNTHSGECCGIHVHLASPLFVSKNGHLKDAGAALILMVNRMENNEFIKKVSGRFVRGRGEHYKYQAQVTSWDSRPASEDAKSIGYATMNRNNMFKVNGQPGTYTLEMRLWDGHSGRLPVALEMAHSLAKFILQKMGRRSGKRALKSTEVPHLSEWAAWVKTKKGYTTLRNDPAFIETFC